MKIFNIKKNQIIFVFLLFLLFNNCISKSFISKKPKVIKGLLYLKEWDLEKDGPINLDGEWEFYWNNYLYSDNFKNNRQKVVYIDVPGVWDDLKINNEKIKNIGFATYRLTILTNQKNKELALKMRSIFSAYTIYVNGIKIGSAGKAGDSFNNSMPQYFPQVLEFNSDNYQIEIIIHVSNFFQRQGGPWESIKLGTNENIKKMWEKDLAINFFLFGSIFIMGLYYLSIFIIRNIEKPSLFFSLFCFLISIRLLVTGDIFILKLLPYINWQFLLKLEYLSLFLAVPVFLLFVHSIFPDDFPKRVVLVGIFFAIIFSTITLFTPVIISSNTIIPYQAITISLCFYLIYFFIRSSIKKINYAAVFSYGFFILAVSIINDILFSNGVIKSVYTFPVALFIFIFFESFVISLKFSKAFLAVEMHKNELDETNKAYLKEIELGEKLAQDLVESHENILNARLAIILGLAKLAEYRDKETGLHLERIREYVLLIANELKKFPKYKYYINDEYIDDLYYSSILHDIGKVGIPDQILLKPGKLTTEEFEIIKQHSIIGGGAINVIESKINDKSYLALGKEIAYYHHEKWNGTGYPRGLKGEEIPLSARIVAIADVYDALVSKRIYKDEFSHETAVEIINKERGIHFDPDIVDAFNNIKDQFYDIRKNLP